MSKMSVLVRIDFEAYGDWVPCDIHSIIEAEIKGELNVYYGDEEIGTSGGLTPTSVKVVGFENE